MGQGIGYVAAQRIYQHTRAHSGGTFFPTGQPVNIGDGYALSVDPAREQVVPLDTFTSTVVAQYALSNREYITQHNLSSEESLKFIGTWVDDGQVYLDVSTIVRTRDDAQRLANKYGQLAYFDLNTMQTVNV